MFKISCLFISFNILEALGDLLLENSELAEVTLLPLDQSLVSLVHLVLQIE